MSWYKRLFGMDESDEYEDNQNNFLVDEVAGTLRSKANDRLFQIGQFSTPSLANLRKLGKRLIGLDPHNLKNQPISDSLSRFSFDHIIQGDVLLEHAKYPGAVFQAASQFNCLEFSNGRVTPEIGVACYSYDHTQGPACALACAAGTVYRNYFVDVASLVGSKNHSTKDIDEEATNHKTLGQRQNWQINNLDDFELAINNGTEQYFTIRNGYTFSDEESLLRLQNVIQKSKTNPDVSKYDDLLGLVKIGLHRDVGVTFRTRFTDITEDITVTQAYCSALSCAYSGIDTEHWTEFAQLVLDANYEATLWAGALNVLNQSPDMQNNRKDVFISFIGGGAFGNDPKWICGAIGRALAIMHRYNAPIRVHICHFCEINPRWVKLIEDAYLKDAQR